jgi:proteasome lid subunit RPN8/RPN11
MCALAVWDYLSREPDLETGCLIINDGKFRVVPFVNTDPTCATIRMGAAEDFDLMVELHMQGKLWGWAHSHPHGSPYPSMTDLSRHAVPVNMVIWGGGLHRLSILSTNEVNLLHDYVTKQQPGLSPTIALERLCKTT